MVKDFQKAEWLEDEDGEVDELRKWTFGAGGLQVVPLILENLLENMAKIFALRAFHEDQFDQINAVDQDRAGRLSRKIIDLIA